MIVKKILTFNAGSSSLKCEIVEIPGEKVLFDVRFTNIGPACLIVLNGKSLGKKKIPTHKDAVIEFGKLLTEWMSEFKCEYVGHRVVHGGELMKASTKIDADVVKKIESLVELAPIHNEIALQCIKQAMKLFPKAKHVGVFDTAFHSSIPKENFMYGIPKKYYEKYGIRRYGFHGLSYSYVLDEMKKKIGRPNINIIACHIGQGASICAIKEGKSYDTTMGFTPLSGIIMDTRSGDIDPAIIPFVEKKEKMKGDDIIHTLNHESGLYAITGKQDFRDIHAGAEKGNKDCLLAMEMLTRNIVKVIGGYNALLGGAEGVVFSGGIGEGADYLRIAVMKHFPGLNVHVVNTNEGLVIAKEVAKATN